MLLLFSKLVRGVRLLILLTRLKMFKVRFGKGLRGNRVYLKNIGSITIGDHVGLNSYPGGQLFKTNLQTHCKDARLTIGAHCRLNGTTIHCRERVEIGSHCLFGPGTTLVDNDSHRISIDVEERRKLPKSRPIIIKDNVWVGMNVLILKGVTIGPNTIVAAHSVVTSDVPENCLAAGNPARVVRELKK